MDANTKSTLQEFRQCLLTLNDSGEYGFEGLLAAVLSEICGQPFRLASSGAQRGRDGDSAFDAGATYFEAKLYEKTVPKGKVGSKLLDLSIDDSGQVDTWALCATSPISTQHAELYRKSLERAGIGCLILDWATHSLPVLAALLAMTPATTARFLSDHSTDKSKLLGLPGHLTAIAADSEFENVADGLRTMLREPTLGLGIAKAANKRWFAEAFSDRRVARQYFGQPLAPLALTGASWINRPALLAKLEGVFAGPVDRKLVVVRGEEGTGKSWLTAKAWLDSTPTPLLALFSPGELVIPMALHDIEGTLVEKLAQQTGGALTQAAKFRWQRRLRGWRANPNPANVRIIVWVDGVNQVHDYYWPRWIDAAAAFLEKIGGRLIVTTTAQHFAQNIKGAVTSDIRSVVAEEWSLDEVKAILKAKGVDLDKPNAEVFTALSNPRILGIAIELLNAKDIERIEELSVERLLFEHMLRYSQDGVTPMTAQEFATGLQQHADEIIARLSSQQHDDLKLFDARLDIRLKAVSNSRFFKPVAGEPGRYEIKGDGLPLALGLSLIAALRKEERNGRHPTERLAVILEPILALTSTADVIYAALLVACMNEDCPVSIAAALVRYYVGMQNVSRAHLDAFEALAKSAPEPFMKAAQEAALFVGHLPNMESLVRALLKARIDAKAWEVMTPHIAQWLSGYSLAPEVRMISDSAHDAKDKAKVEAERAKRKAEIQERLTALSPEEQSFMERRLEKREETHLDDLHALAFHLLAGVPLSRFAPALANWSFSNTLNSSLRAPNGAFQNLVQLNTVDWSATKQAMLEAYEPLEAGRMSDVGEWALVGVLRATGDAEDARRAAQMVEHLTTDRKKLEGWRLIETYCATDPCDPSSESPDNIEATAATYAALDVAALRQGRGGTEHDHLFSEARTGLARFKPETAINVLRRFAGDVVGREGLSQRQGLLSLAPHSAALQPELVDQLVAVAKTASADASSTNLDERHLWTAVQYALLAALPHKSGNDQLAIIAALPVRSLLLRMLKTLVPADASAVEGMLESSLLANDVDAQLRAVSFVHYSNSPVSPKAALALKQLMSSSDKIVRAITLAIVARLADRPLLEHLVESQWQAGPLDPDKDRLERWHGSSALIAAVEVGILDINQAFDRMAPQFYGFAARRLGTDAAKPAAARIDIALKKACAQTSVPLLPAIERPVPENTDRSPPLLSLVDEPSSNDIREFFERLKETPAEFDARQERAWHSFDAYSKRLTADGARLILDDLPWEAFETIVSSEAAIAKTWLGLFNDASRKTLKLLHYFALGVASASAKSDPPAAANLLRRLSLETPLVNQVFAPSGLPVAAVGIWINAHLADIKHLCFQRLNQAHNDEALSVEVLAAFLADKQPVLQEYVDRQLGIDEPSAIARALMVSGLSDTNAHASAVLQHFAGHVGFIGNACTAAQYAYDRNDWSRQWFNKLRAADTPQAFWRFSVLLTKMVDSRYDLWRADQQPNTVFERFFPTIEGQLLDRIKAWKDKRRKTLFGQTAPDPIFLAGGTTRM